MKVLSSLVLLSLIIIAATLLLLSGSSSNSTYSEFQSSFPVDITRSWLGPEYWANPLQDWQLNKGRIECNVSGGNRNVFLLTHELGEDAGDFNMSVLLGIVETDSEELEEGWIGFKIGIRGEFDDYRDSAVRGEGFRVGMTTDGQLFIGAVDSSKKKISPPFDFIRLELIVHPDVENYKISLSAFDKQDVLLSQTEEKAISDDWIFGGVALVCSREKLMAVPDTRTTIGYPDWGISPHTQRGGNVRFWFSDWKLTGSKVKTFPDRKFGPILFVQHTLSNKILKITAQMAPVSENESQIVILQVQKNNNWKNVGEAEIDKLSRTASFRVEDWDTSKDTPYRVKYEFLTKNAEKEKCYYTGTIRKVPWKKEEIVVAGFTGNNDLGFPNTDIYKQIEYHNPDILFFSGDQIYEGVAGYGVQRKPMDKACLDYLRKWYLYGWAYGELMKDRPVVAIPDDHDVYHGNIWGCNGKATPPGLVGSEAQDEGGYKMPAEWINVVQRTQTSHLPDPYDPTPIKQNIGVYYCAMNYAGLSVAILEDRKFKSAPKALLPEAQIHNGWAQNRDFDEKKNSDVKTAKLLGDRQLKFLHEWTTDWSNKAWMKVVFSQTIFANVATLPREDSFHDRVVPRLRIMEQGEYAPDDVPVSDMDSNGWPQTARNKALRMMRRAFAFHLAGDQHLGSTIQYGVDDWYDAGFAFCVPAISNVWPRRWYPSKPGLNRLPNSPKYTGDFEDGFGNKMTVFAVSNPVYTGKKPAKLYDRATGYGIVRFNRTTKNIILECWPRQANPASDAQYPGWPITINMEDNYGRKPAAHLPTLIIAGITDPVIQVVNEKNSEIVYTLRIKGNRYQPKVFENGEYTVRIGELGTGKEKVLKNVLANSINNIDEIKVNF
jgi:alkaline phosphatase D